MSGGIIQRIADQIHIINKTFEIRFKKELIRQNARAIARLKKKCSDEEDFIIQIATLATLVDDFDKQTLCSCLRREYGRTDSLFLLEQFLDENKLEKETIIDNFRFIKRVRSTTFPIHKGGGDFLELMREIGRSPPYEWDIISRICADKYLSGLVELYKQIEKLVFEIKYEKIETRLRRRGFVTYPNDVLFDFRVILDPDYAYKHPKLVDCLTAATIAFCRNLKSVNYALKKYVIPFRNRFREHLEDLSFAGKRRYLCLGETFYGAEARDALPIFISPDVLGIRDHKEFKRYFNYVKACIISCQHGVTPDWIINMFMAPFGIVTALKPKD